MKPWPQTFELLYYFLSYHFLLLQVPASPFLPGLGFLHRDAFCRHFHHRPERVSLDSLQ